MVAMEVVVVVVRQQSVCHNGGARPHLDGIRSLPGGLSCTVDVRWTTAHVRDIYPKRIWLMVAIC
jgi:hypothetical protein